METIEIEAELVSSDQAQFIQINAAPQIRIPVSDDNANDVKTAFCALLQLLKSGPHRIVLKESKQDLLFFVATEYLNQLNQELQAVHEEMERHGFTDDTSAED